MTSPPHYYTYTIKFSSFHHSHSLTLAYLFCYDGLSRLFYPLNLFILYLNEDSAELLNLDLFAWKSEKFHRSRIKFQRTVLSEFYIATYNNEEEAEEEVKAEKELGLTFIIIILL